MIDLRDLRDDDAGRLFLWRRSHEVDRWMCGRPARTWDEHQAWFARFRDDPDARGWIIDWSSRPVGFLVLRGLPDWDRRAPD